MHYRENQKIACELSVELVNNRVLYMKTYTSHNGLRRELAMLLIGDVWNKFGTINENSQAIFDSHGNTG